MFKIISEGQVIDICDKPNYIRLKQETGCFVNTDEAHAEGVGVRGTAYNLPGHVMKEELKEALVLSIDDNGRYIFDEFNKTQEKNEEIITAVDSMVAPTNVDGMVATQFHPVGEYVILNNTLYKVTSPIARGVTIIPGINVEETTVMKELDELK